MVQKKISAKRKKSIPSANKKISAKHNKNIKKPAINNADILIIEKTSSETKQKKTSALKKLISKHTNIFIIEGMLFFLLAIMMMVRPTQTLYFIVATLGIVITVFGVFYLVRTLTNKNYDSTSVMDVIFSVINIILGVILIIYPQISFSVFITFLAIIFLVRGIYFLLMSVDLLKYDTIIGITGIIVSLLSLLLFGFVIFYPIAAAYAATYYIAICLIVYAITDFVLAYRGKKIQHKIK